MKRSLPRGWYAAALAAFALSLCACSGGSPGSTSLLPSAAGDTSPGAPAGAARSTQSISTTCASTVPASVHFGTRRRSVVQGKPANMIISVVLLNACGGKIYTASQPVTLTVSGDNNATISPASLNVGASGNVTFAYNGGVIAGLNENRPGGGETAAYAQITPSVGSSYFTIDPMYITQPSDPAGTTTFGKLNPLNGEQSVTVSLSGGGVQFGILEANSGDNGDPVCESATYKLSSSTPAVADVNTYIDGGHELIVGTPSTSPCPPSTNGVNIPWNVGLTPYATGNTTIRVHDATSVSVILVHVVP